MSEDFLLRALTPDQGWMWLFGSVTKCLSFSWIYTGASNSSAQVAMPPKKCGCEMAMARMPPLSWICLTTSGCSTLMQSRSMLPSSAGSGHGSVKVTAKQQVVVYTCAAVALSCSLRLQHSIKLLAFSLTAPVSCSRMSKMEQLSLHIYDRYGFQSTHAQHKDIQSQQHGLQGYRKSFAMS